MSLAGSVWEQIRRGRPPDQRVLAEVVDADVVTLGSAGVSATRRALEARMLGAGPLEPLLQDERVTDVAVNGDGSVWVDRGDGMQQVDVDVGGPEVQRQLAVRLAGLAGRRLDETAPYVDGQLPSGVRLHAVLPPLVAGGPHLTLRVPARSQPSLEGLGRLGMFPAAWAPVLRAIIENRVAFVISGGTGVGKTTLLAALLGTAPARQRLVIVEDVRELRVDHAHVVRLEARPANVEGHGEVTMTTLVRQALRMRPDRLIVGEVRGAEVRELLTALNTGHEGGCGTLHANAAPDVVARFEALGALAGLDPTAVHTQLASAVCLVLHPRRDVVAGGPRRVIESIGVVRRSRAGPPEIVTALSQRGGRTERGPATADLRQLLDGVA